MPKWIVPALVGLVLAAYVAPLGVRPLFAPDECRYAEIPREMLATGNWVSPRLDSVHYFEKPALGYWLTAVSMAVFGLNKFAARLPSALAAALTALAVFLLVQRYGGGRRTAALAAAALLSFGMFFIVGCDNILDMPLTLFLSAGMVCFYFA